MKLYLGIDTGSISVKMALINEDEEIILTRYRRHQGQPIQETAKMLKQLSTEISIQDIQNLSITGMAGAQNDREIGHLMENEIICQARSAVLLYPNISSIIEMGGQDSKLILLEYDRNINDMIIKDFAMNTICAAGTGSFLDQQANRLGLTIEELGELSLNSKNPPRIAGRCSVFAKSDMIHLQQEATPVHDIVAGLCFAVARNFISSIARGKKISVPVAFHGGVASNSGMARAFRELMELDESQFRIHEYHKEMGAIGAALIARKKAGNRQDSLKLLSRFLGRRPDSIGSLPNLRLRLSKTSTSPLTGYVPRDGEKLDGYLGVDVGSISTNLVVIDSRGRVLSKRYLMTAGRPIEAVRRGMEEVGDELAGRVNIKGVCTTGSGRYLTGDFIGADVVRNEITAQATAAIAIDPSVDTIFEIGGQDSKYISIDKGVVVDFEMNKVCAAGTGSFLEEQAEKLGISIKGEFGRKALTARTPCAMGERCTVFIESDIISNQQKGASCEDLVGGLSYSIVHNYLNKVVGDKRVGNRIFFQGGTAYNDGVVAGFEAVTGKRIVVPDHHEVTGAIGCALIARQWHRATGKETSFRGFEIGHRHYEQDSFECKACSNNCEIRRVTIEGEKPLFYGGRCEKYETRKKPGSENIPDLFGEREEFLMKELKNQDESLAPRGVVGIPRVLYFFEQLPYWTAFFKSLGYRVELSDETSRSIVNEGLERVLAESCFPVKVSHGHVLNLIDKGVDFIFLPSFIGFKQIYKGFPESAPCPYGQALPYMLNVALELDRQDRVKILSPVIDLSKDSREVSVSLRSITNQMGVHFKEITRAVKAGETAQSEFHSACQKRGIDILTRITREDRAIVIISRPYNGCDPGLNLDLPRKLKDLGALAIPMDFLPTDDVPIDKDWPFMTWKYGQKILASADIVRDDPRLNALYISNFGCGPDSFLFKFFRKRMGGKTFLQIEVDEHSADAGVITRCEAFLDSINSMEKNEAKKYSFQIRSIDRGKEKRTVYLPYMCDHAHGLRAAFSAVGVPSEVLPESDMESLYYGRKFTTGKECYPCIVTVGDFVRFMKKRDFDPDKSAFFMPTAGGGCRFGYYNILQRIILDELGYSNVPIFSPNQTDNFLQELGVVGGDEFFRLAWKSISAIDLLSKALHETRPCEKNRGQTREVYDKYLQKICNSTIRRERLSPILSQAHNEFLQIPVDRDSIKPIIGVVGEIFVRMNRFSNNHLIENLEEMGAEVWLAPMGEWILYVNHNLKEDALMNRDLLSYAKVSLVDAIAKKDEHKLTRSFNSFLRSGHEPPIEENIRLGGHYVDKSFRGETILSLGKAVDFFRNGLSGIINVMPFTCMPGTVVNSMLKRLKQDCQDIPILNLAYDGLDMSNNSLRLSAFVHQCRQYTERHLLTETGV